MATTQREAVPPVLLGGSVRNQNPLKLLEVLVKGFCPNIIVDRVDVHDDDDDRIRVPKKQRGIGVVSSSSSVRNVSGKTPITSTTTPTTPRPHHHHHHHRRKRGRSNDTTDGGGHDINEKPFEIGERPPSDVIGITKKIWEGFCYDSLSHPSAIGGGAPPLKKIGFCSVLTDPMGCSSASSSHDDDSYPPDGEECSVGTYSDSSASAGGCGVDLSPQSSPHGKNDLPPLPRRWEQSAAAAADDLDVDDEEVSSSIIYMDEYYCEDEEEDLCIAEFQDRRTYRGTQVLLMTILALYATLSLLRATGNTSIHFALESKHSNYNNDNNIAKSITFAISSR